MRARLAPGILIVALLATGCAGGGTVKPAPTQSGIDTSPKTGPGTVLTDALTSASCAPSAGVWAASGVVKNTTKDPWAFDVTIQVGPPNGAESIAHVTTVPKLAPGKSAAWKSPVVETNAPAGPCHIQVSIAK